LLYGSDVSSVMEAELNQEPELDVTRQILGDQESPAYHLAADSGQVTHNWNLPFFYSAGNQTQDDIFASVPEDHWAYAAVPDTNSMVTLNIPATELSGFISLDQSGPTDARVIDLALSTAIINTVIGDSRTAGTVSRLGLLSSLEENQAIQPYEIDNQSVNPTTYQNLALYDEMQVQQIAVEQEVLDDSSTQALRAEEQAQLRAALQQRAQAVYNLNLARVNIQISGVQFTVRPEE
jgi:hypothetical protein